MEVNVNTGRLFLGKLRMACKNDNDKVILEDLLDLDVTYLGVIDQGKSISVLNQVRKDYDGKTILDEDGNPIKKYPYQLENEIFDKDENDLKFVHIFISNLKRQILGTYHGINLQYLDLFCEKKLWHFNARLEQDNLTKITKLISAIFNTKVTTKKDFKKKYDFYSLKFDENKIMRQLVNQVN